MACKEGTFGITGINVSPAKDVKSLTKVIPYAPGMPVRYEIATLASSTDPVIQKQWTLFVLALEQFKNLPVDNKLSFFQVAGIHSYPETPWDLSATPKQDPKSNVPPGSQPFGGYCHHNTIAFPTWHRPYMLLYEQCIWLNMGKLVDSWKLSGQELTNWTNAKDAWRLPYWDWARTSAKKYALPDAVSAATVPIFPPPAAKITNPDKYPNPLAGFVNPEKDKDNKPLPFGQMPAGKEQWNIKDDNTDPSVHFPWSKCSGVSRWGICSDDEGKTWTGLEGVNNIDKVNEVMADFPFYKMNSTTPTPQTCVPSSLSESVNRMFTPNYNGTWGTFASTKWYHELEADIQTGYLSLEYIHNNVHNNVGGTGAAKGKTGFHGLGHMMDVPVAAFDPIFWLHHCNIDRFTAMWQALNPDKWWDTREATGDVVNVRDVPPDEALAPFHTRDNGDPSEDYWTSTMARDWTKLFYQYDDLVPSPEAILADKTLNERKYQTDLLKYVQEIYPNTSQVVDMIVQNPDISNEKFLGVDDGSWPDYIINVVYDRYALNGRSYSIQFYLGGDPNNRDSTFEYPENFVGKIYSFGGVAPTPADATDGGGCANCTAQNNAKVLSKAQVPLTHQLIRQALDEDYHHVNNIVGDDIENYLAAHLHWKFVAIGDIEKEAADFPDTKISVWSGTGTPRTIDQNTVALPPKYDDYSPIHAATDGKTGGLTRDDPVLGEAARAT